MKAYLAIKFKEDNSNKKQIENICRVLENSSIETISMIRDYEKWGEVKFSSDELMTETFKAIDSSELIGVEFSEKGVGLGIEAGYAYAKGKPIIVIAKEGSDISNTLKGISKDIIFYKNIEEVGSKIKLTN